jgi:hypothetical protein
MRNSPRKRGSGAVSCNTPVEIFTTLQLLKIPLGELRNLAAEKHGIQNAGLMKKPELHRKLKEHFEARHAVVLKGWDTHVETDQPLPDSSLPISQTIDKLRHRIKDKAPNQIEETVIEEIVNDQTTIIEEVISQENVVEEIVESSLDTGDEATLVMVSDDHNLVVSSEVPTLVISRDESSLAGCSDKLMELAELATPDDDSSLTVHQIQTEREIEDVEDEESQLQIAETSTAVATITGETDAQRAFHHQEVVTEEVIENSEDNLYEEYISSDNVEIVESVSEDEVGIAIVSSSTDSLSNKVYKTVSNSICRGYVVASSVKELRDLGRDMLRIHAENHGIEHAGRLRMPDLLKEVIQHYNSSHQAGLELTRLEMLKLNMLKLKKVKVPVREKTPPPDFSNVTPKNVVPLEEQVHHVYEKRPDVCTVDIIVDNLKDMLALGTSILRPEASKHRVANSSRKQKLQVVEELWDHYIKFHLKGTAALKQADHIEEEYESDSVFHEYQDSQASGFIVVREEDIVQGEEIQAVAEEIAE